MRLSTYTQTLFVMLCAMMGSLPSYAQDYEITLDGTINGSIECGVANLSRTVLVSGGPTSIADLNVGFLAQHTYRGDMRVRLISPASTTVQIIDNDGVSDSINEENYNVILDDVATDLVNTGSHVTDDGLVYPSYENLVRPNAALSAFNGENANGVWTLEICDDYPSLDNGQFRNATLSFPNPTDADLSLVLSANSNSPTQGGTVTLTFDLQNSGPANATGVTSQIDLPTGLTFNSYGGVGTYNDTTGLWTLPSSLASGTTSTLTINATVEYFGPYDITGEISAATENDPNSTPNNSVTTEDDFSSLTLTPIPSATPPSLTCSAGDQFTHSWSNPGTTNGWNAGALSDSYTVNGHNLDFTITGNTGSFMAYSGTNTPVTDPVLTGGFPAANGLFMLVDFASNSNSVTVTLDVGTPGIGVGDLQFSIYDVDYDAGAFTDRITISGSLDGAAKSAVLTPSASNSVSGSSVIGTGASGLTSGAGNMTATFLSQIDQVTITYDNAPGAPTNPAQQGISIAPITMCPPVAADLSAVKTVEVYDPDSLGLYMTPGNEVLYKITVTNSATATASADDVDISDTLPDNLKFVSASTTGFIGGAFGTPALPATNTDCGVTPCIVRFSGGDIPINTTAEISVRALIK